MNIALVISTHSEYSDLWQPLFERFKKYLKITFSSVYICTDTKSESEKILKCNNTLSIKKIFYYEDSYSYPMRFKEVLNEINEEYVLIWHDNNILVNDTDINGFNEILKFLEEYQPDQLRLHAGSARVPGFNIKGDIYKMHAYDVFKYSVYPTIWKKNSIQKLFELFPNKIYREIEGGDVQNYTSTLNNYFIWNLEKSPPRGCGTELTPHIIKYIHFVVERQWAERWDKDELIILRDEFNINLSLRGKFDVSCFNSHLPECYNNYKQNHICNIIIS